MSLEKLLKISIKENNFDGMVTTSKNGSRVVWWQKGKVHVHKIWTTFKVDRTVVFSCVEGELSIY